MSSNPDLSNNLFEVALDINSLIPESAGEPGEGLLSLYYSCDLKKGNPEALSATASLRPKIFPLAGCER